MDSNAPPDIHALDRAEFTRRVLIVAGVALLAVAGVATAVYASDIFFLLFAAILLAILLHNFVHALARRSGLSLRWSFALTLLVLAGLLAGGVYAVGAITVGQFNQLSADMPQAIENAREQLKQYPWGEELLSWLPAREHMQPGAAQNAPSYIARFFSTTFGVLVNLIVLGFAAFYLAIDPQTYVNGIVTLTPPARRERARQVLATLGDQLHNWMLGRLGAMIVVALIVSVGLWLLGFPQFLALGLLAGLLTAVPYIGPIVSALPGLLLALSYGGTTTLWVLGVYVVSQAVEDYLLTPLIDNRTVHMEPVVTLAAVALAGALFGVLGVIVAAPLAVVVQTLVKMLYVEDVLGG